MYKKYIKKILDKVISLIIIILFLPLFLIISFLIKIIDKNKIIYKQERTGINGNIFYIYKFSTFKDGKITKFGKILRKTSLDEFPQMFNIIKGDMSFIGPRPWIPDYYKYMNENQRRRVNVLPGLTGLAQINGRNGISIYDKINYDIEYIDNCSFKTDIYIIFKTIYVIIKHENVDLNEKGIKGEIETLKNQ